MAEHMWPVQWQQNSGLLSPVLRLVKAPLQAARSLLMSVWHRLQAAQPVSSLRCATLPVAGLDEVKAQMLLYALHQAARTQAVRLLKPEQPCTDLIASRAGACALCARRSSLQHCT